MNDNINNMIKTDNLLIHKHPDLLTEWDYEKNNDNNIDINTVTCGSGLKAWWRCLQYKHSYCMQVRCRTEGQGCPYCAGRKVLSGFNDLASQRPELINSEWDYASNDARKIYPDSITIGSGVEAYWKCSAHGHSYMMPVYKRTRTSKPLGCPYCSNHKVKPGYNDLESNHPEIMSSWDWDRNNKNKIYPNEITSYSSMKAWFTCDVCMNSYEMRIFDKTRGIGCPYCAGQKTLTGFNDLQTLYPDIAAEWYQPLNGNVTPDMVSKSAKTIIITDENNRKHRIIPSWKCSECGHIWKATVANRIYSDTGCPKCWQSSHKSKQEDEVASYIQEYLDKHHAGIICTMHRSINFTQIYDDRHVHIDRSMSNHMRKELDIYIPELNLAVEYDGDYWHDDEIMLKNKNMTNDEVHAIKQSLCKQAGVKLVIITEHDWLHDTEKNKNNLVNIIDMHITDL